MIPLAIYISSLKAGLVVFSTLWSFGLLMWQMIGRVEAEQKNKTFENKHWPFVIVTIAVCMAIIIPSKETTMLMFAGYAVEQAVTSDRAAGIADNSLKVIEKMMGEYLNEEKAK